MLTFGASHADVSLSVCSVSAGRAVCIVRDGSSHLARDFGVGTSALVKLEYLVDTVG
jgi:hypothetical protein